MSALFKQLWKRREVILSGAGFLLSGFFLSRCGSSTETKSYGHTSDSTGDSHTITLNCSDFESPPSGGVSVTSSSSNGHTHTVTLTETQLSQIKSGTTVQATSSSSSGHTHVFPINAC